MTSVDPRRSGVLCSDDPRCYRECRCSRWPYYVNRFGNPVRPITAPPSGMLAWYKADSIGQADGTAVVTWNDSSGNGYHVTQGNVALQPVFRTGIQNGLPAVRFAADWLANVAFSDFPDSCSIYVAGTHTVTDTAFVDITDAAGNVNSGITLFQEITNERFRVQSGGVVDRISLGIGAPITALFDAIYSATVRQDIYINGVLRNDAGAVAGALTNVLGRLYLGTLAGGAAYNLTGDLFEVLIYTAAHADAERQQTEQYMNGKWALY